MAYGEDVGAARHGIGSSGMDDERLTSLVQRTISALNDVHFALTLPGVDELRATRKALLTQLSTRILPHLERLDLPAVVVLAGSTGAGKSTIMNSIIGSEVSKTSIVRPTTREPVILISPTDSPALEAHDLMHLGRVIVDDAAIPGLVLIDAPDLDSVETAHRDISDQLLDVADLWVFVTTSQRYGDAVAWNTLQAAHNRGMTCAVVLNRIADKKRAPISRDLQMRLINVGMDSTPLFIVPDEGPGTTILSEQCIAEFDRWLRIIAETRMGKRLMDRTTSAVLPKLREDLTLLADGIEAQAHALVDLKDKAVEGAQPPRKKLVGNILAGRFGAGSPTTAWLSMASGGGQLEAVVSGKKSLFFNRRRRSERDAAATVIFDAVYASASVAVTQAAITAIDNITQAWENDVVDTRELISHARDRVIVEQLVSQAVEGWKADVAQLGRDYHGNSFLGDAGIAALIGVAAGGIAGAMKACQRLGLENHVREARHALVDRSNYVIDSIISAFAQVADSVNVGNASILRLRSGEFAEHMRFVPIDSH